MERDFDAIVSNMSFSYDDKKNSYYGKEIDRISKIIINRVDNYSFKSKYLKEEATRDRLLKESDKAMKVYDSFLNNYIRFRDSYEVLCFIRLYINIIVYNLTLLPKSIRCDVFKILGGEGGVSGLEIVAKKETDKFCSDAYGKKFSLKDAEKRFLSDLGKLGEFMIINKVIDENNKRPYPYDKLENALISRYGNYENLLDQVKSEIDERLKDSNNNDFSRRLNVIYGDEFGSKYKRLSENFKLKVVSSGATFDGANSIYVKLSSVIYAERAIYYLKYINKLFGKSESIKKSEIYKRSCEIIKYLEDYKKEILSAFNSDSSEKAINSIIDKLNNPYNTPISNDELKARKKKINEMMKVLRSGFGKPDNNKNESNSGRSR